MVLEEKRKNQPVLSAFPTYLQFGDFNAEKVADGLPSAVLTISNTGDDVLAGRISPQVAWIRVEPPDFSCAPDEVSTHQVFLDADTPHTWQGRTYSYDYLMLINSNGGSFFIGGSYTAHGKPAGPARAKIPARKLIIPVFASALLVIMIGILILLLGRDEGQPGGPEILFTHGAETVIAELTRTAAIQPVPKITENVAFIGLPGTQEPGSGEEPPAVTLTPWPRDQFPNPEQFVRDYYTEINRREYETAWSMLSETFQQSCCSLAGNDPFQVYVNWWDTIEKVEVVSAYLQAWDANPAEVYATLRYTTNKGEIAEVFNNFKLIADPEKSSLLIDEVK